MFSAKKCCWQRLSSCDNDWNAIEAELNQKPIDILFIYTLIYFLIELFAWFQAELHGSRQTLVRYHVERPILTTHTNPRIKCTDIAIEIPSKLFFFLLTLINYSIELFGARYHKFQLLWDQMLRFFFQWCLLFFPQNSCLYFGKFDYKSIVIAIVLILIEFFFCCSLLFDMYQAWAM